MLFWPNILADINKAARAMPYMEWLQHRGLASVVFIEELFTEEHIFYELSGEHTEASRIWLYILKKGIKEG